MTLHFYCFSKLNVSCFLLSMKSLVSFFPNVKDGWCSHFWNLLIFPWSFHACIWCFLLCFAQHDADLFWVLDLAINQIRFKKIQSKNRWLILSTSCLQSRHTVSSFLFHFAYLSLIGNLLVTANKAHWDIFEQFDLFQITLYQSTSDSWPLINFQVFLKEKSFFGSLQSHVFLKIWININLFYGSIKNWSSWMT